MHFLNISRKARSQLFNFLFCCSRNPTCDNMLTAYLNPIVNTNSWKKMSRNVCVPCNLAVHD